GMMITAGADKVIGSADELTAIDAKFGDADHGLTMTKIANAMKKAVADSAPEATIKSLLDDVASAIMVLNGGSAVPLWNTLVDGLAQGAPDSATMDAAQLKAAFKKGYEELYSLSKANVGDKTMMDALAPAIEAICGTDGTIPEMMQAGASAAEKGAEDSKNYVAKFGRARSYKEQTLGTPDAGAMSMKYFFVGLSDGCKDVFNK
ncbi:MAG: DAK2 domain-containing protein, partial [Oscillospiraceae bacterium]